jgi:hypothetical protein
MKVASILDLLSHRPVCCNKYIVQVKVKGKAAPVTGNEGP